MINWVISCRCRATLCRRMGTGCNIATHCNIGCCNVAACPHNSSMDFALLKFSSDGLIPVVAQNATGGSVLMLAYADREAIEATENTGFAHFHSRSRAKLWMKGESSGNRMAVLEIRLDCDGDSLLYICRPEGPTCHTGTASCFARTVYGTGVSGDEILSDLESVLRGRMRSADEDSYTGKLLTGDPARIRSKVSEEAFEVNLASERNDDNLAEEIADLWFHTMLLLLRHESGISAVFEALRKRQGKRR